MKVKLKNLNAGAVVVIGAVISILLFVLLLCIFSYLIVKNDYPVEVYRYFWYIASAVAALTGGLASGRLCKSKGIIWGSLTAVIFGIVLISVLLAVNSFSVDFSIFLLLPVCIITGAAGGIISSNIK